MWINSLKIAIIEKNTESLNKLLDEIPEFTEKKDIEEALYLLRESSELLHSLKDEASKSMKLIKKNLQFLKSTDIPTSKKLDIKS